MSVNFLCVSNDAEFCRRCNDDNKKDACNVVKAIEQNDKKRENSKKLIFSCLVAGNYGYL